MELRRLLEAAGEVEVDFALRLKRWHVSGRFDKLLASAGGYEIVDWKSDKDGEPRKIVERHTPQMKLYALALYRAGRAAIAEGSVRVHLAMLHPMLVQRLYFSLEELEDFAGRLVEDLERMDAYQPDEAGA
jgi:hypothetical protein